MQLVLPVKEGKAPPEFPPDSKTLTPDYKKAQSRSRPCAILQISVYKRRLVGTDNKLSKHCSVRIISDELRDATAFT